MIEDMSEISNIISDQMVMSHAFQSSIVDLTPLPARITRCSHERKRTQYFELAPPLFSQGVSMAWQSVKMRRSMLLVRSPFRPAFCCARGNEWRCNARMSLHAGRFYYSSNFPSLSGSCDHADTYQLLIEGCELRAQNSTLTVLQQPFLFTCPRG